MGGEKTRGMPRPINDKNGTIWMVLVSELLEILGEKVENISYFWNDSSSTYLTLTGGSISEPL